jgi:hypothetical protein
MVVILSVAKNLAFLRFFGRFAQNDKPRESTGIAHEKKLLARAIPPFPQGGLDPAKSRAPDLNLCPANCETLHQSLVRGLVSGQPAAEPDDAEGQENHPQPGQGGHLGSQGREAAPSQKNPLHNDDEVA